MFTYCAQKDQCGYNYSDFFVFYFRLDTDRTVPSVCVHMCVCVPVCLCVCVHAPCSMFTNIADSQVHTDSHCLLYHSLLKLPLNFPALSQHSP